MTVTVQRDHHDGMRTLQSYPLDPFEVGVLTVARHFLDTHRCPETQAWHRAYSIASERWGDRLGLPAAHLLARFVTYATKAREDGFDHIDPFCQHSKHMVTPDEADLMLTLHYMRRDDTRAARQAVENLTKGRLDPDVIRSGLTFANRFPSGPIPQETVLSAVKLRVVG